MKVAYHCPLSTAFTLIINTIPRFLSLFPTSLPARACINNNVFLFLSGFPFLRMPSFSLSLVYYFLYKLFSPLSLPQPRLHIVFIGLFFFLHCDCRMWQRTRWQWRAYKLLHENYQLPTKKRQKWLDLRQNNSRFNGYLITSKSKRFPPMLSRIL